MYYWIDLVTRYCLSTHMHILLDSKEVLQVPAKDKKATPMLTNLIFIHVSDPCSNSAIPGA